MGSYSAIVLAGGLGTRLKETVPDVPKALAPIRGVPFLKLLIEQLETSGVFSEIVLALGFRAEMIQEALKGHQNIRFSVEESLLGTGGALLHALPKASGETLCVLNGDSFSSLSFERFLKFHEEQKRAVTLACTKLEDTARFGTLEFNEMHQVTSFVEKTGLASPGWVSIGIYGIQRQVLKSFRPGVLSLERDFFPKLLYTGITAFPYEGPFIDIGTKESYTLAQGMIAL